MTASIGRRVSVGFAIALLALAALGGASVRNLRELNESSRWVVHTLDVIQRKERFTQALIDAESAARGYQITGADNFKIAFTTALDQVSSISRSLRKLTADNPTQQARLDQLDPLVAARLELSRKLVESRATNASNVSAIVAQGSQMTRQIRAMLQTIENDERALLNQRERRADQATEFTWATLLYGSGLAFVMVALTAFIIIRSIVRPLQALTSGAERIGSGDFDARVIVGSRDETGRLAAVFNEMAEQLASRAAAAQAQDRLKTSVARFSRIFEGQRDRAKLAGAVLDEVATTLGAQRAVFYVPDRAHTQLQRLAVYAADDAPLQIAAGEGLAGEVMKSSRMLILDAVPQDYFKIGSALGEVYPAALIVLPVIFEGSLKAVLEVASLRRFDSVQLAVFEQLAGSLGTLLHTIEANERTEELLSEAQRLSETLLQQQNELAQRNRELQDQTELLTRSEGLLQQQQEELTQANEEMEQSNEELQQANEEMEEKAALLALQKQQLEDANRDLETARAELVRQTMTLQETSQYKSQFLANMSHELRTPLNSLLILSKLLAENSEANLSSQQVQYATTIHSSGNDLLQLINDILDLSKIESGTVELEIEEMSFGELRKFIGDTFEHVAQSKQLDLRIGLASRLPRTMITDTRRLQQILKNLLSNAFKFTAKGSVELQITTAADGWGEGFPQLDAAAHVVSFAVHDSGIGIAPERQQLIFEAFQQADAGTARKYGGTGLGLSISRELARLLGGTVMLKNTSSAGSTFILYLPAEIGTANYRATDDRPDVLRATAAPADQELPADFTAPEFVEDDRNALQPGDLVLLIIEDDAAFVRILIDFAREKGFKVVAANTSAAGVRLAVDLKPTAITLDLRLPDGDGWIVLDRLKHDPRTRHIPVHVISGESGHRERSLRFGAISYLQKPVTREAIDAALIQTRDFVSRPVKQLLLIEDDATQRDSLKQLIGNGDVATTAVATGAAALAALSQERFDCIVLDLGLPDIGGVELIRNIQAKLARHTPPIIVYTGRALTRAEETELKRMTDAIIIKDVKSPERLLDETALFLHRIQARLPESKRKLIEKTRRADPVLAGRKVLVVDDDVRNIFAITAALENSGMDVIHAENGREGLELLQSSNDVAAVLMDVMMPEMDGIEATRRIRAMDRFKTLPVIAVTAKAMKGDRESCLEAGASDYITKPVDMDQLRSLLRVWLYR